MKRSTFLEVFLAPSNTSAALMRAMWGLVCLSGEVCSKEEEMRWKRWHLWLEGTGEWCLKVLKASEALEL